MKENRTYKFAVIDINTMNTIKEIDWNNNDYVMFTTEYEPEDAAHEYLEAYADKTSLHDRIYYVKNLDKNEIYKITIKPEKSVVWLTDNVTKID